MKKITFIMALAMGVVFASCGNNKSTTPKDNGLQKAGEKTEVSGEIAYVEIDSLNTQLEMCKEGKAMLEAKSAQYRNQLSAKQKSFQNAYAAFQKKMQTSGYASQAEYESAQKNLQRMQEEGAKFEQQCAEKLAVEQDKFNQSLRDSLQAYIKIMNKDHRYKMILSKAGDNILYCDPSCDITKEVVAGMNKRYTKTKK